MCGSMLIAAMVQGTVVFHKDDLVSSSLILATRRYSWKKDEITG